MSGLMIKSGREEFLTFFCISQSSSLNVLLGPLRHKLRVQKQLPRVCLDAVVSKSGSEKQNFKKLVEVEKGVAVADLFLIRGRPNFHALLLACMRVCFHKTPKIQAHIRKSEKVYRHSLSGLGVRIRTNEVDCMYVYVLGRNCIRIYAGARDPPQKNPEPFLCSFRSKMKT